MGRGRKPNYRGGHRQFTDVDTLKRETAELNRRQYRQRQDDSNSEEDDDSQARGKVINRQGAVGELPPSESSEGDSDEDKGSQTPARAPPPDPNKSVKLKDLTLESMDINDPRRGLNRKEREELARQEARKRYLEMTATGKNEEGQANLARLAIIKQQREDAAKKRAAQQAAKEAEAKARAEAKALAQGRKV